MTQKNQRMAQGQTSQVRTSKTRTSPPDTDNFHETMLLQQLKKHNHSDRVIAHAVNTDIQCVIFASVVSNPL